MDTMKGKFKIMKLNGLILSDEHFGVIDADRLYDEHVNIFLEYTNNFNYDNPIDFIVITGDYFDHILQLNEKHAGKACLFMRQLLEYAGDRRIKVRIVYGTESHECNQYEVFNMLDYVDNGVDVKLIKHACEEELFDDFWVLYLPEEYIYNKTEYYKDFFTGEEKYNYIFGHGVIEELMGDAVMAMKKSKSSNRAKVPVFTSSELLANCKGEVYFGHYHINSSIKDRIFYVGSFTRWQYGEEEPKGFYHAIYENGKYSHKFIENTMAEKYETLTYGYENNIFKSTESLETELKKIENLVSNGLMDNCRLILNIPEDYENPEGLIKFISERVKDHKNIKIKVTNGYIVKSQKINEEYLDETKKKYNFIFDKSMPIKDILHQYILIKFEKDIPSDIIDWHLKTTNVLKDKEEVEP